MDEYIGNKNFIASFKFNFNKIQIFTLFESQMLKIMVDIASMSFISL